MKSREAGIYMYPPPCVSMLEASAVEAEFAAAAMSCADTRRNQDDGDARYYTAEYARSYTPTRGAIHDRAARARLRVRFKTYEERYATAV